MASDITHPFSSSARSGIASRWQRVWYFTRRNPRLVCGSTIVLLIVLCAVFAPWLSPHSPYTQSLSERMVRPVFMQGGSWTHPLGTDALGRDYLSRLLFGARYSLLIGFGTVLISAIIGIGLGVCAGYFGGWFDRAVMFLLTVRLSMPVTLVAISIIGLLGNSLGLLMAVLASFLWDRFLVIARSLSARMRDAEFVLSARAAGSSDFRIMWQELMPNLAGPLLVVAALEMAHAILLEATFSFLGLGIRPPASSWGLMIAEAKDFVFFESWLVNIPGIAIFTLIVGITLLGSGLQTFLVRGDSR